MYFLFGFFIHVRCIRSCGFKRKHSVALYYKSKPTKGGGGKHFLFNNTVFLLSNWPVFHLMDEMSSASCCITEHAVSSHHFHIWQIWDRKVQLIASASEKQPFLQAGGAGWHTQEEDWEDVCVCVCWCWWLWGQLAHSLTGSGDTNFFLELESFRWDGLVLAPVSYSSVNNLLPWHWKLQYLVSQHSDSLCYPKISDICFMSSGFGAARCWMWGCLVDELTHQRRFMRLLCTAVHKHTHTHTHTQPDTAWIHRTM